MSGNAMLDRFVSSYPCAVLTRAIIVALMGKNINKVFEGNRSRQYSDKIQFPTIVVSMCDMAFGLVSNRNEAYRKYQDELNTSATAFYGKINRTEPAISETLVEYSAEQANSLLEHLGCSEWTIVEGYRVLSIDGNHLSKTEKRLKESRISCAAPLPGTAVARYDHQKELFDRVYLLEDAQDQETIVLDRVVEDIVQGDLILADRNSCVVKFILDLADVDGCFAIRHHGRLKGELLGKRSRCGRCETGMVYEQLMRITDKTRSLVVRRITIELDAPTRDGDTELHVLSNLPEDQVTSQEIADLYLTRWEIENAFHKLTTTLVCEQEGNCHPRCALLLFCMAIFAYNCRQVLLGALYAVHPQADVERISHFLIAKNTVAPMEGLLIAINEAEWDRLVPRDHGELAAFLIDIARKVNVKRYRKAERGPKKPPPKRKRCEKGTHVSAHRLLQSRK